MQKQLLNLLKKSLKQLQMSEADLHDVEFAPLVYMIAVDKNRASQLSSG